jgi:hypothetical protein
MKAIAEEAILDSNIAGMMEKNYIGKWEELNTEMTQL